MSATAPRILVADDQPDVLEALKLLLKGEGYDVQTATSPRAVLTALDARDFDALLIEPFRPGRGVPGVVHVDQEGVEITSVEGGEDRAGRGRRLHVVAFTLEEQFQRLEDIRLVVSHQDPGGGGAHGSKVPDNGCCVPALLWCSNA